ncbi:MAG TPA: outer membrane lipid asymmetry maintenance protein MlaD [Allosphingosinicella sp.]|jgi:phospholipid/cholesterol/gamma-HCH transport system substrate-binding protein|uniref:outer membrane lipid asymmetry maintenance protein MlaD n=1 Tax=Allosphingosinicella sp. TaxID=2823234 RepID=UPI002F2A7D25
MKAAVREHLVEAGVGLLVVLAALWFVTFAVARTGGGAADSIRVKALFPAANGVSVGTDVRIAGLKVGTVAAQRLEPQSYQAEVTLALDRSVSVPSDSSAAITSESLLGGSYVALLPGGSETPLKNGDTILETQGSVDMMSLVGSVINRSNSDAPSTPPSEGLGTMDEAPAQ